MRSPGLNMRNIRHNMLFWAVIVVVAWVLNSCDNKDLCLEHRDHALRYRVDFRTDWSREWQYPTENGIDWQGEWSDYGFGVGYDDLRPTRPSGVRAQVYTDGHNNENSNIPADGGIVNMPPGEHQILFYNNDTEYIVFNNINTSAQATATTRSRSRATYIGNSTLTDKSEENTVNPPDFLYGHYIDGYTAEKSQEPPVVDITMKPLVFRYLVRYRFDHGLNYVALCRGALAGMAASVYLTDGHTGSDAATVLYDCEVKPWGIEAIVNTFGVPDYPNPDYSRASGSFGLNLEVKLVNGLMLNFDFDVTDQIVRQPRGGVIEVGSIDIPDELVQSNGGGAFDVGVDGWGEFEDIIIDFGNNKDN